MNENTQLNDETPADGWSDSNGGLGYSMHPLSNLQIDDLFSISFFSCIMLHSDVLAVECKLVDKNGFHGYGRVPLSDGMDGGILLADMRASYDSARTDLKSAICRYAQRGDHRLVR